MDLASWPACKERKILKMENWDPARRSDYGQAGEAHGRARHKMQLFWEQGQPLITKMNFPLHAQISMLNIQARSF